METREECAGGFKRLGKRTEKNEQGEKQQQQRVQLGRSRLGFKMGEKGKGKEALAIGSFARTRM